VPENVLIGPLRGDSVSKAAFDWASKRRNGHESIRHFFIQTLSPCPCGEFLQKRMPPREKKMTETALFPAYLYQGPIDIPPFKDILHLSRLKNH